MSACFVISQETVEYLRPPQSFLSRAELSLTARIYSSIEGGSSSVTVKEVS